MLAVQERGDRVARVVLGRQRLYSGSHSRIQHRSQTCQDVRLYLEVGAYLRCGGVLEKASVSERGELKDLGMLVNANEADGENLCTMERKGKRGFKRSRNIRTKSECLRR